MKFLYKMKDDRVKYRVQVSPNWEITGTAQRKNYWRMTGDALAQQTSANDTNFITNKKRPM